MTYVNSWKERFKMVALKRTKRSYDLMFDWLNDEPIQPEESWVTDVIDNPHEDRTIEREQIEIDRATEFKM